VDARAGVGIGFADERQELAAPPKPSVLWRRCVLERMSGAARRTHAKGCCEVRSGPIAIHQRY